MKIYKFQTSSMDRESLMIWCNDMNLDRKGKYAVTEDKPASILVSETQRDLITDLNTRFQSKNVTTYEDPKYSIDVFIPSKRAIKICN